MNRRLSSLPARGRSRGFTLLELLLAFVVFALGFATVLEILSGSMRNTVRAREYSEAALIAQSLMDTIGIEIPLSALFAPADDPEKRSYVWIVDPGALQVSRREVAMQQLTRWGVRVGGLKPGERVVTVGVHHLREGQRISLLD